ncbi:DUF1540 domain-containing protein [Clostridium sp. CX1]|uniref:DUF1540 domain-containing protein n=1 Tax=Clostridium tanneri TaxID=3037988 RepID=A0ABU4JPK5_9CLOT|nr:MULTISPECIES: DUF1540 domain-containing protein [unclassified Clostridium]MCT8976406.1 DUF1540 domain-containing protein [Clostridium sp. CX1]MDW8800070.1 DUF1540 domain-containing protein [Clostridium sp. A1-XYC3]
MSGKLRCSAKNCYNNVNEFCIASSIHVMGEEANTSPDTMCDTFLEKTDADAMSHFTNRNLAGEFRQLFSADTVELSPDIVCEAQNCVYNVNRICSADFVQVHGPNARTSESTECETFRENE